MPQSEAVRLESGEARRCVSVKIPTSKQISAEILERNFEEVAEFDAMPESKNIAFDAKNDIPAFIKNSSLV